MKIIMVLSNSFDPDPRVYKEAKTLIDSGNEVELHCWDRENKYHTKEDVFDRIKIRRYFPKARYGSGYKQIFSYIQFIIYVIRNLKGKSFDIIHCHDFDTLIIGILVKSLNKNIKVVYDQHDLFYQYFYERKGLINKTLYYTVKIVEQIMLKHVWKHIVVTSNMKKLYTTENTIIINNAPYLNHFKNISKLTNEILVIGFIGAVRHYKELKMLIDVAQKFHKDVKVQISGRGTELERLKEYSNIKDYDNVVFTGEFSYKDLEVLYKQIDITYAVYPETAYVSMPNKFFESIITETPMIVEANSEFGKVVEKEKFGFIVDANSNIEEQLEDIIKKIISERQVLVDIRNNMRTQKNEYVWEANIPKLNGIYQND